MTRRLFDGTAGAVVADALGNLQNATGQAWRVAADGVSLGAEVTADCRQINGTPFPGGLITTLTSPKGKSWFRGPDDGTNALFVAYNGGEPMLAFAVDGKADRPANDPVGDFGWVLQYAQAATPPVQWFSSSGVVARALGWKILTDPAYGAVLDGVADDTAAAIAAVNAAKAAGKRVWIGHGTLRLTAGLDLDGDNTLLTGSGYYTSTIYRDFAAGPTVKIRKAGDLRNTGNGVIGVTFTRNLAVTLAATDVAHIKLVSCDTAFVQDIRMPNCVEGIQIVGGNSQWYERLNITGDYAAADKARFAIKFEKCATAGTGTSALPTSISFSQVWVSGPTVNGAGVGGFAYPLWITAGENLAFDRAYFGQGHFYTVLIEQGLDNALIIDTHFTASYIDAADRGSGFGDGVYVVGAGVAAGETWDGVARAGGNGSQYIGNVAFNGGTIKGQGGDGRDGVRVDGTSRGGAFPQALNGLHISPETVISAWYRHGTNLEGGVGAVVRGNHKGNNYTGAGAGSGIVLGPNCVRPTVVGARSGCDAYGASATGLQVYGVRIDAGCSKYLVTDTAVYGNATAGIVRNSTDGICFNNPDDTMVPISEPGSGLVELARWGAGLTPVLRLRSDVAQVNTLELIPGTTGQAFRIPATGSDANITMQVEPKGTGVFASTRPFKDPVYTVATLPAGAAGWNAFASDGRKNGEGAGAGTGVKVWHDGIAWRASDTGATVSA